MFSEMDKLSLLKSKIKIDEQVLSNLFHDLELIHSLDSRIVELGVDGGAMIDIIYGLVPKDFDLRYSAKANDQYIVDCICDEIMEKIKGVTNFKILSYDKIDLNNINEHRSLENCESLESTIDSIYSPNSCFNNIPTFTSKGEFLCSEVSFDAIVNKIYMPNFLGYMSYYFKGFTHDQYYEVILEMVVRGVSYIVKRNLTPNDDFMRLLKQYHKLTKAIDDERLEKIINMKFESRGEFEKLIL
jgi:hypothetical protein